jgi:hypothetical protein
VKAKYSIMVRVVRSVDVEINVEADSEEAAKSEAEDRAYEAAQNENRHDAITEASVALTADLVGEA